MKYVLKFKWKTYVILGNSVQLLHRLGDRHWIHDKSSFLLPPPQNPTLQTDSAEHESS